MEEWITNLKQIVMVVLICEFLKELLSTDSFRKYVQFAINLLLFSFLFCSLFRIDFSLPEFQFSELEIDNENLVIAEYESQIAASIREEFTKNNVSVSNVSIQLNDQYEITAATIFSQEHPTKIQTILKGEFPYEVVNPTQTTMAKESEISKN